MQEKYTSIKSALTELGLSEFDSRLYLSLFKTGGTSISALATELSVQRPTIYAALDRLRHLGLIPRSENAYKRKVLVEPPTRITILLERQQNKLRDKQKNIFEILPDLMAEYALKNQPSTLRIFEGRDQYLTLFEESVQEAKDEILYCGNIDVFVDYEGTSHEKKWIAERIRRKVPIRMIVFPFRAKKTAEIEATNLVQLRETRYLDKKYLFESSFLLYGYKTFIWNPLAERAVILDDPTISAMFKQIFELTWDQAKETY
ncbi:MAG: hypothetical protein NTY30_04600 [Candidatus Berkelbacteria bacterium]|nr:hypothetical protein [Candidatus Berkelbacteria bacterium]